FVIANPRLDPIVWPQDFLISRIQPPEQPGCFRDARRVPAVNTQGKQWHIAGTRLQRFTKRQVRRPIYGLLLEVAKKPPTTRGKPSLETEVEKVKVIISQHILRFVDHQLVE